MTPDDALERAANARVARLATVRRDGTPHVVPLVFALVHRGDGTTLYWAVDHKPKRSNRLARIENLATNRAAEVVVDAYDEDWSRLWWVRLRGTGRVVADEAERAAALDALARKYAPYRERRPDGEVIAIDVEDVSGWDGGG